MSSKLSREIMDREFLPTRAKILEIAASLDRLSRISEGSMDDPRWWQLHEALRIVLEGNKNRAEQIQLLFSRSYDENWREAFPSFPRRRESSAEH